MLVKLPFKRCWIAEAITAAGTIGGAAINAVMQHRTNAQNRAQADYAFQQEQMAIQRQNEYNSPAQQVLRMKAAGLNPSLAYGADGAMVGNQADVPAYNAIPAEAPNVGNIGAGIADAIRTGVEVRDLKRREDLAVAEKALKDAQSFLAIMSGLASDAQRQEILTLMGYKAENIESQTYLNYETISKVAEEVENLKESRKEIQSRVNLNEQQIKTLASQCGLNEAQAYVILQRLPHELMQMDANSALAYCQSEVGRAQIGKIAEETSAIEWYYNLDVEKFNFDKNKFQIDDNYRKTVFNENRNMWLKDYRKDVGLHLMDNIGRITSFAVGGSAMRNGTYYTPQRIPSPIYVPGSTSFEGQTYGR